MTEEEKYIKCKNCKQDILESKMFLHEGFCLRNNKLCPECDKVFLVQEYEEHLKTHNSKKPPDPFFSFILINSSISCSVLGFNWSKIFNSLIWVKVKE